jgi:hypothetical protein
VPDDFFPAFARLASDAFHRAKKYSSAPEEANREYTTRPKKAYGCHLRSLHP